MKLAIPVVILSSLVIGAQAQAATTVYTDAPVFLSSLESNYFLNTFTGPLTPVSANSYSYSGQGFSYTVTGGPTASGTWLNGEVIGTNYYNLSLTVAITSGNVNAVGGEFFGMDLVGGFTPASVSVMLSDSTTVVLSPSSKSDSFRGFISDVPILSVTILPAPGSLRAIDNLTVGMASPVPEVNATSLLLIGLTGLTGLAFTRQRTRPPRA